MSTELEVLGHDGLPTDGLWVATGVHAALLNLYEDHADDHGLIPKSAIDPAILKRVLPYLLLIKKTDQEDWQFTVVGTDIVAGYGTDFSGALLSQLDYSPCRNVYQRMIEECITATVPLLCMGRMRYPEREVLHTQKTIFPISDNGSTISHCLFGLSVDQKPRSVDTFYKPVNPLGAVDSLYAIAERAYSEGVNSRFVTFMREIKSD